MRVVSAGSVRGQGKVGNSISFITAHTHSCKLLIKLARAGKQFCHHVA
jgi:hypothetical protein